MDLQQYLKSQFELYPPQFRDVASFMGKSSVREQIMRDPQELCCPLCQTGQMRQEAQETKKGESRWRYACCACRANSGEWQKSISIAYWQLFSKKTSIVLPEVSPVVQLEPFLSRCAHWHRVPPKKAESLAVEWIASTKWLKRVWSQHRNTIDFSSLSEADQLYVDAIGAAFDVLKKHAVQLALSLNVDVQSPRNSQRLAEGDRQVRLDRKRRLPHYQENLSPDFRQKAIGLFS